MVVLLLMAIIGAAAVFQIYRFNTTLTSVRADEASLAADVATLRVTLADLRAAEAGYVGTGQVPAAWMTRATTLISQVESLAGKRRAAATTTEGRSHYDNALAGLKSGRASMRGPAVREYGPALRSRRSRVHRCGEPQSANHR